VIASALRREYRDFSRAALVACVLLAGCAAPRVKTIAPDSAMLAKQTRREQTLAAQPDWQLEGRLGVSTGKDSGSGSLQWKQDGAAFRFSVHAPVTGKTWVLTGDPRHAMLEGLRDRPVEGDDATTLLERELGWHVPVAELSAWVRGARASGDAKVEFREDGLPATIVQDGWTIEYPDYDTSRTPALPRKVFASRGEYRVRLAVSAWQ
jgi:outer membrane lipoprotein LolB